MTPVALTVAMWRLWPPRARVRLAVFYAVLFNRGVHGRVVGMEEFVALLLLGSGRRCPQALGPDES
jgi:hypothetical protein